MVYESTKRAMDIIGALALIFVFFPICIITALAILWDSPGTVFADTPKRVGQKGKKFKLYKFRSMVANAHTLLRTDPKLKTLYDQYRNNSYKLNEDPRVTRIGKFIRKHSIDEIPQLLNVLRGDMSLVGPRPYYPDELVEQQRKYPETKKLVRVVLKAKPGITGLWQVSGRSEINFDKRIQMDAVYVQKRSILFDLFILAKSPWVMITGKGAV